MTDDLNFGPEDLHIENQILKDIERTFPYQTFFKEKCGLGQRILFKILRTFSKFNTETQYVQGMGFFTACFLNFMDEESSFWMLKSLMDKYKMNGFYKPGFPDLAKAYYKTLCLLNKYLPKVYEHLVNLFIMIRKVEKLFRICMLVSGF